MADTTHRQILLTGASGRVGRMVLRHWQAWDAARAEITPQYRDAARPGALFWDPKDGPRALLEHMDRSGTGFDALVMLAGVTPGPGRDVAANPVIAGNTLAAAHGAGIKRVLVASSSAVYGAGGGSPLGEDAPCAPVNAYGAAKLEMEAVCDRWRERGIETCALRIGNVAGADALLLNVGHERPASPVTLDIFDDGAGPIRSYVGPRSMAEALETLCLLPDPLPSQLNFAAPRPVTMAALATAAGAPIRPRPAPEGAHQRITLDCRRLVARHDFAPSESEPMEMVRQWRAAIAA